MELYKQSEELLAKRAIAEKDFELLNTKNLLGNYLECEFTHIVIEKRDSHELFHYFGIISYEEFLEPADTMRTKKISTGNRKLTKNLNIGIYQFRISLTEAQNIFEQLKNGILNFHGSNIKIPTSYILLPKTFVPSQWDNKSPLLNKVLKPTIFEQSYILEFFCPSPPLDSLLGRWLIKEINLKIKSCINIDLSSVSDRIGSFIFQFPISTIHSLIRLNDDLCNIIITIENESSTFAYGDISTSITSRIDNVVTGFATIDGTCNERKIPLGDSNNLELLCFCKSHLVILNHYQINFIRSIHMNMGIDNAYREPRTFINRDAEKIEIQLTQYNMLNTNDVSYWEQRIQNRMLHEDILSKRGRFKSFIKKQRQEALQYIHEKIHPADIAEIWLIDPFLTVLDIFESLYYCLDASVQLRCISSLKKAKEISIVMQSLDNFKKEQQNILHEKSNNLGINLEWRTVHDNHGTPFHDRYLMLIPSDKKAIATIYSLGTSVNSLGNAHHLIQQVLDPIELEQIIRDFWDELKYECCIVAKIEGGKIK